MFLSYSLLLSSLVKDKNSNIDLHCCVGPIDDASLLPKYADSATWLWKAVHLYYVGVIISAAFTLLHHVNVVAQYGVGGIRSPWRPDPSSRVLRDDPCYCFFLAGDLNDSDQH